MDVARFENRRTNNQASIASVLQYFKTCFPPEQPHVLGEHDPCVKIVKWWFASSLWYHLPIRSVSNLYSFTMYSLNPKSFLMHKHTVCLQSFHQYELPLLWPLISSFSSTLIQKIHRLFSSGVNITGWLLSTVIADDGTPVIAQSVGYLHFSSVAACYSVSRILLEALAVTDGNENVVTLHIHINI